MNEPIYQLLAMALTILVVGGGAGFFIDHQRRKYHALAEAEREANHHPGA